MISTLAVLYKSMDAAEERLNRDQEFERLGRMTDEQFDSAIQGYIDDDLKQFWNRMVFELKNIGQGFATIGAAAPGALKKADQVADKAADGINALTKFIKGL